MTVVKIYIALAIIGGAAMVLSLFVGISPCVIYHITGLPCPACGLTRAFIAFVRLDMGQAFFYHPLFWVVPFVPLLALRLVSDRWRNILAFAILGLFVAVWVVRLAMFFPYTPPLDYNESSLFAWLFRR